MSISKLSKKIFLAHLFFRTFFINFGDFGYVNRNIVCNVQPKFKKILTFDGFVKTVPGVKPLDNEVSIERY